MKNVWVDPVKKVVRVGAAQRGVMSTMRPTRSAWPRPAASSRRPGWRPDAGWRHRLPDPRRRAVHRQPAVGRCCSRRWPAGHRAIPERRLFWALRGGGGNFGVVTSFEFQLHEVGDIVGGPMFYEFDDAAAVLECYREFITDAPEQLGCFFGWQIAPPCRLSPRTGSGICSVPGHLLERPRTRRPKSTPATTRRCRSESGAGRGHAVPGPQQRLRRSRPEGHAATGRQTSSPSSPTRRSRLTSRTGSGPRT